METRILTMSIALVGCESIRWTRWTLAGPDYVSQSSARRIGFLPQVAR